MRGKDGFILLHRNAKGLACESENAVMTIVVHCMVFGLGLWSLIAAFLKWKQRPVQAPGSGVTVVFLTFLVLVQGGGGIQVPAMLFLTEPVTQDCCQQSMLRHYRWLFSVWVVMFTCSKNFSGRMWRNYR